MSDLRPRRSVLYMPAANERALEKAKSLPAEPWDSTTWKTWTDALKTSSGRKGKQLFMPLRLALTGLDHGPELAALLPESARPALRHFSVLRQIADEPVLLILPFDVRFE